MMDTYKVIRRGSMYCVMHKSDDGIFSILCGSYRDSYSEAERFMVELVADEEAKWFKGGDYWATGMLAVLGVIFICAMLL